MSMLGGREILGLESCLICLIASESVSQSLDIVDLGQMICPIMGPVLEVLAWGGVDVPEVTELPDDSVFLRSGLGIL